MIFNFLAPIVVVGKRVEETISVEKLIKQISLVNSAV